MIALTLAEVAEVTGGRLSAGTDPATAVTGPVVVDSRMVRPGALFVAVPGEHVDGHDFAERAVAAGAAGVLATRALGDLPCVVADEPLAALALLARSVLDRLHARAPEGAARGGRGRAASPVVVGITGSSGKTSTKDLLAAVLDAAGPTVAAHGSFNNELGVPLTVLRADEGTRYLVVEMGARGVGHIAHLCQIAAPTVGVVLNVGTAHAGEFGDRDVTARSKGELVESLPPDGVAVLNADDPLVAAMAGRTSARVLRVGQGSAAQVRARDVRLDAAARPTFELEIGRRRATVALRLHGEHHVSNALAAAGAAHALGLALPDIATALSAARAASRSRMEVVERSDGVTVVNDAYNANPESMSAALKALAGMSRGRRSWAVLGEMLELGAEAAGHHDAVGRLAVRLDISRLVVVGRGALPMHTGAVHEGSWGEESVAVSDLDEAFELVSRQLRPGDVVLVKSSRGAGLSALAERLVGDDAGSRR